MNELDLVRSRSAKTWGWLEETVQDVSPAQANWWPPGTANSIGATYLHAAFIASLDAVGEGDLDAPVDMTRAELGIWQGRDLLYLHGFEHVHIHGGEISCLKGMQGGIGWRESDAFRAAVVVEDDA